MGFDLYNYKIYRYPKKLLNALSFMVKQKYFSKPVKLSEKDKIIYVVPGCFITGGVLSILNMFHIAKKLFPDKEIFISVLTKFQKADKFREVNFEGRVINLKYFLPDWLNRKNNILFHVYEDGLVGFLQSIEQLGLLDKLRNSSLNILNQNNDLMPAREQIENYLPYFKRVTMTLAYKENEKISFPYLDMPAMHVGAFFDGASPEVIPYEKKKNLCVLSDDDNPVKPIIKDKLIKKGIEVYDSYPIPYGEFVELQKKAKWTISFGEGWDGYTMGQFENGGIGFGVYQENFQQPYFDKNNLPQFLFTSFEEMNEEILDRILSFDEKERFEEVNKKWRDVLANAENINSCQKVKERWINYYKKNGFLDTEDTKQPSGT